MDIVLDKSFLDGAPTEQVRSLCQENVVLFSESLLFELMTTDRKSQKRCFSKFPETLPSVKLIPNVGTLLRYEAENKTPCTPLAQRVLDGDYQFNEKLRQGTYVAEGDILRSLEEWEDQVREKTNEFLVRCNTVYQFFPELNGIERKNLQSAIADARKKTATDEDFVKAIYKSFLENENALANAPDPELIGPNWAFFRYVQCQLLSTLRMFGKHQGKIKLPASGGIFIRAEHTTHDIYYTTLATLSEAVATGDQDIIDDFCLCCPKGFLVKANKKIQPTSDAGC